MLHSLHDYICPACGEPYLPFAAGIACPKCKADPPAVFEDVVPEVLALMEQIYESNGGWQLPGYRPATLGDIYLAQTVTTLARRPWTNASPPVVDPPVTAEEQEAAAVAASHSLPLTIPFHRRDHFAAWFRAVLPTALAIESK